MESAAGLIKLKSGYAEDLEEWRKTLESRRDEVIEALRGEGVVLESWFQIEIGGEPYLLWFMRANCIAEAERVFLNSTHEVDAYHMAKMLKISDSHIKAVPVIDLSIER